MGAPNIITMQQILLYTSNKKLYYIRHWHYTATFYVFHCTLTFFSLLPVMLQSASHSLSPQQAFISLAYKSVLSTHTCIYRLPQQKPELLPLGLATTQHLWLTYCPTRWKKFSFLTSLLQHTGCQFSDTGRQYSKENTKCSRLFTYMHLI
jgi:hypothetical protein